MTLTRRPARTNPHASLARAAYETLERRLLLAAPQIEALPIDASLPEGRSLFVPLRAQDPDGGLIAFSAEILGDNTGSAGVEVLPRTNTVLRMDVAGFGPMVLGLYDDVAPETARRIAGLARSGYYDGLTIFRVIDNFVLQFGDPTENGQNPDPIRPRVEFQFDDEFDPDYLFTGDGQLAMANAGKDTNTSQFFITDGPQRPLDGNFTLFGQLLRGFDVRDQINALAVDNNSRPFDPPVVSSVRVVDAPGEAVMRLNVGAGTAGEAFDVRVTARDDGGESSTRTFTFTSLPETTNSPAVFLPFNPNRITAENEPIVLNFPAADPENDDLEFEASFTNIATGGQPMRTQAGVGTLGVDQETGNFTFTPEQSFTGPATFFVYVRDVIEGTPRSVRGNTSFPFDLQQVTVAVGEEPASGQARTLRALRGVPLNDVVVATFNDADTSGTADDWTAQVDWGDGTVSGNGTGTPVVVRAGSEPGTFEVVSSHTYAQTARGVPVAVTITGDLGGQLEVVGSVDVSLAATFDADDARLTVNGTSAADDIRVAIDGGNYVITVNGSVTTQPVNTVGLIEVFGHEGDDNIVLEDDIPGSRIFGVSGNNTIRGGMGNDEIFGGDGNDVIDGNGGNDYIEVGTGNNYAMGGTGIDYDDETRARGFFNRDTIIGGPGNDTLSGGSDANLIMGMGGNNVLNGSGSRDTLIGGDGNDMIRGFGNSDLLIGGDGDDTLIGDAASGPRGGPENGGNDTLEGGNGNDVLRGVFGDNVFRGGTGNDTIFGGTGNDTLEDFNEGDVVFDVENILNQIDQLR